MTAKVKNCRDGFIRSLIAAALIASASWLACAGPAAAESMSLAAYKRLAADQQGEAALRWYFTGIRDTLRMFEEYEIAATQIAGLVAPRAQSLYCIPDDITLTTELLRSFVELAIERTDPESHEHLSVNNAIMEELVQVFPCQ